MAPTDARHPPAADSIDCGERSSRRLLRSDDTARGSDQHPSSPGGHGEKAPIAVGPGIVGSTPYGGTLGPIGMNPLPIQPAKIRRPPLRFDVLSRERLNDWLERAVNGRLALVIAEAGFGKTTLLADWARRSSRTTAWYRLEPDDRDWLAFVRHLVATGREVDANFGPRTFELLLELGPGGPTQEDLIASIVGEMADLAASMPNGLTLLFDDYHAVDGSPETEPIMAALLDRTGSDFSLVVASRSAPSMPLGGLRSRATVSRIDGKALCFDERETDRLFRDAYHQPLEPDVVVDLVSRTEGWAALIALVHANMEGRSTSELRNLVRHLSGATGDLWDYLTEEVLDHVPEELARFLVRASLLESVDPENAVLLTPDAPDRAQELIRAAEALGLLTSTSAAMGLRFAPLVREYLLARLTRERGPD